MGSESVDTRSIYRELGTTLSYNVRSGNGMEIEPWLKAAVRKESVGGNRMRVNSDGNFVNDLSGRREMYQIGIKASFSSMLSGHLGAGYSRGISTESPWSAVVGMNWSFWPSTIKLRFGAVFIYRMLKGKVLGQRKARQLRREISSYERTMSNEIAGLLSPRVPMLAIGLFTQPGVNTLFYVWEQP